MYAHYYLFSYLLAEILLSKKTMLHVCLFSSNLSMFGNVRCGVLNADKLLEKRVLPFKTVLVVGGDVMAN